MLSTAAVANAVRRGFLTFTDVFNRSNANTLGDPWRTLGSAQFDVVSNAASSSAAPSSYPMAVVDTRNTAVSLSASVSNGAGVAFWVTDSSNWWAVTSQQTSATTSFTFSCNCSTNYFSCNCRYVTYACDCYLSPEYTCVAYSSCCYLVCPPGVNNSDACTEYCDQCCSQYVTTYYQVCRSWCSDYVCDTCSSESCQTCTGSTTTVTNFLRVLRSLAATVTTVASAQASAAIAAVRAVVSGNSVTATAFSNTAKTQSVASTTATVDSPAKRAGIIVTPSGSGQGNTVDDFMLEQV
jgi:hypothetical protein